MGNLFSKKKGDGKGAAQPPAPPKGNEPAVAPAQPQAPKPVDLGPPTDEYKVLVLGELNVGKTNLLLRFCDGMFVEEDPTHTKPPPEAHLGAGNDRVCATLSDHGSLHRAEVQGREGRG